MKIKLSRLMVDQKPMASIHYHLSEPVAEVIRKT